MVAATPQLTALARLEVERVAAIDSQDMDESTWTKLAARFGGLFDPELDGSTMSRQLLGPGLLGLIVFALAVGVVAASAMDDVVSTLLLLQTVTLSFGAAVMLMFFCLWLTVPAVWACLLVCIAGNVVGPLVLGPLPALRTHPTLVARATDSSGRFQSTYYESVVRTRPDDLSSPLKGRDRLQLELGRPPARRRARGKIHRGDRRAA